MRRDILAACKRSGVAPCTTNDFRRTHATMLSEAGVDRDVTRRLLGHTTTKLVDLVYGQPSTAALGALAEEKLLTAAPVQGRYIDPGTGTDGAANSAENSEPISRLELETCGLRSRSGARLNPSEAIRTGEKEASGSGAERNRLVGRTETLHGPSAWGLVFAYGAALKKRGSGSGEVA
jgi:hypothetical protein